MIELAEKNFVSNNGLGIVVVFACMRDFWFIPHILYLIQRAEVSLNLTTLFRCICEKGTTSRYTHQIVSSRVPISGD